MIVSYVYELNQAILLEALPSMNGFRELRFEIARNFRNHQQKRGKVSMVRLREELPHLSGVDLNFYYVPGNPNIKGRAQIELRFDKKEAILFVHGNYEWYEKVIDFCIDRLALVRTQRQQTSDFVDKVRSVVAPHLFDHIKGSLYHGNNTAALSAAVVFIEDRLRIKARLKGMHLSGADLVLHAYKTPGVLEPPLPLAANSNENAFLLVRGWFGYVRNLHGHQSSLDLTLDEAFAQITGANYVLWIIENSRVTGS